MTAERTCDLPPFLSPVVAQVATLEQAGSALEILTQTLENYLASFRSAVCDDLTQIVEECCGATDPISFLQLTDTPDTYAGAAGDYVTVNAGATGLEFTPPPAQPEDRSVEKMIFFAVQLGTIGVTSNQSYLGYGSVVGINGTVAFAAIAAGAVRTGIPRRSIVSGAPAGNNAAYKSSGQVIYRGANPREGGFRFVSYFGTASAVAQQRAFFGVAASVGILANVNPSTNVNIFGVGYDSAQTTFRLMHNDAAGNATVVDLGANFPVDATSFFKLEIIAEPNASSIEYEFTNLTTGNSTSGSVNTDLPVNTTFMNGQLWVNNGTTANAVTMEFTTILLEMRV